MGCGDPAQTANKKKPLPSAAFSFQLLPYTNDEPAPIAARFHARHCDR
jgi:hypothetical protein